MKEKVLITGASGFLGYHLIRSALQSGYEVTAAVRKSSDIRHLQDLGIGFTELDYRNPEKMARQFLEAKYERVIHAAGTTRALTEAAYDQVNAGFTENLAQAAAAHKGLVKQFVFISSLAAAGPLHEQEGLITESGDCRPVTAYGKSKLKAENLLKMIDLPVTIFRPTAIYGPRERDIFMVTQYLSKGFDPYIGRNAQHLSFVYGPDMADLAVKALERDGARGLYHVSDGQVYSRYAFADIVQELLGKKAFRIHLPVPLIRAILFSTEQVSRMLNKVPAVTLEKLNELTAANWNCDISLARQELGYAPRFDLRKGLDESLKWYRSEGWLK